jgi:hypothetical protein
MGRIVGRGNKLLALSLREKSRGNGDKGKVGQAHTAGIRYKLDVHRHCRLSLPSEPCNFSRHGSLQLCG